MQVLKSADDKNKPKSFDKRRILRLNTKYSNLSKWHIVQQLESAGKKSNNDQKHRKYLLALFVFTVHQSILTFVVSKTR